jgi:alpha/beta superfamily hydrolase
VGRFDFSPLGAPACPWLILQGDADDVVAPNEVRDWAATACPSAHLVMLPGVGHFFHGHLSELRDAITREIHGG